MHIYILQSPPHSGSDILLVEIKLPGEGHDLTELLCHCGYASRGGFVHSSGTPPTEEEDISTTTTLDGVPPEFLYPDVDALDVIILPDDPEEEGEEDEEDALVLHSHPTAQDTKCVSVTEDGNDSDETMTAGNVSLESLSSSNVASTADSQRATDTTSLLPTSCQDSEGIALNVQTIPDTPIVTLPAESIVASPDILTAVFVGPQLSTPDDLDRMTTDSEAPVVVGGTKLVGVEVEQGSTVSVDRREPLSLACTEQSVAKFTEQSSTQISITEQSSTQTSIAEQSSVQISSIGQSSVQISNTEQSSTQITTTEQSSIEVPAGNDVRQLTSVISGATVCESQFHAFKDDEVDSVFAPPLSTEQNGVMKSDVESLVVVVQSLMVDLPTAGFLAGISESHVHQDGSSVDPDDLVSLNYDSDTTCAAMIMGEKGVIEANLSDELVGTVIEIHREVLIVGEEEAIDASVSLVLLEEPEISYVSLVTNKELDVTSVDLVPLGGQEISSVDLVPLEQLDVSSVGLVPHKKSEISSLDLVPRKELEVTSVDLVPLGGPEISSVDLVPRKEPEVSSVDLVPCKDPEVCSVNLVPLQEPEISFKNLLPLDELKINSVSLVPHEEPNSSTVNQVQIKEPEAKSLNLVPLVKEEDNSVSLVSLSESEVSSVNLVPLEEEDDIRPQCFNVSPVKLAPGEGETSESIDSASVNIVGEQVLVNIVQPRLEERSVNIVPPRLEETSVNIVSPCLEKTSVNIVKPRLEKTAVNIVQPLLEETLVNIVPPRLEERSVNIVQPLLEETMKQSITAAYALEEESFGDKLDFVKRVGCCSLSFHTLT